MVGMGMATIFTTASTYTGTGTCDLVWNNWLDGTGSTTVTSNTWSQWIITTSTNSWPRTIIDDVGRHNHLPGDRWNYVVSERERAAIADEVRQHRAEMSRLQRERDEAVERAEQLLRSILGQDQLAMFEAERAIVVDGRHARYRITPGRVGNVEVIGEDGKIMHRLCMHPAEDVPNFDIMTAQVLMLSADEDDFIGRANVHNWGDRGTPRLSARH